MRSELAGAVLPEYSLDTLNAWEAPLIWQWTLLRDAYPGWLPRAPPMIEAFA